MSKNTIIVSIIIILILFGTFKLLSNKPETPQVEGTVSELQISPSITQNKNMELKIEDIKIGTGKEVKSGDYVVMHYLGTLESGKKFDSSYDRGQPFETQIGTGQVIQGWDQGVPGMKIGGKRKLTIPSELAYGSQEIPGVIPANSTLIFEVELVDIK